MSNELLARFLIIGGLLLAAAGVIVHLLGKAGVGRLPGDIHVQRDGFSFSFPIITCIVVSIVLTVLLNLILRR